MENRILVIFESITYICKSSFIDEDRSQNLILKLDKIIDLYNNKILKLAILGEFSSGKSTFINALLNDNILSYGDAPTTAVNTYINYGSKKSATLTYVDNSIKNIPMHKYNKYLLDENTSSMISKIDLYTQNPLLKDGLIIIDTPGSNVEISTHDAQREKAIADASVGIFLISVQSPSAKSFITFLKQNENNLHKFIFVITKCDLIASELDTERHNSDLDTKNIQRIYDYIKQTISENTKIKKPIIHMISSKAYIENKNLEYLDVFGNFQLLEYDIRKLGEEEKQKIIYSKILGTCEEILLELKKILSNKRDFYERELASINSELSSLESNIKILEETVKADLAHEKIKIQEDAKGIITKLKDLHFDMLISKINAIDSFSNFKQSAEGIGSESLTIYQQSCHNSINSLIDSYGTHEIQFVDQSMQDFFLRLKTIYEYMGINQRLQAQKREELFVRSIIILGIYLLISLVLSFNISINILFFSIFIVWFIVYDQITKSKINTFFIPQEKYFHNSYKIQEFTYKGKDSFDKATGLTGGAIFGALVGGPVGAVIGGGIGALLGMLSSESRLEKARSTFIERASANFIELQNMMIYRSTSSIKDKETLIITEFNRYISEYRKSLTELNNYINEYDESLFLKYSLSYKEIINMSASIDRDLKYIKDEINNSTSSLH